MPVPRRSRFTWIELDAPGEIGLDTHINYVARGKWLDDYTGEEQSRHRLRITPEFSYGLTKTLEAGLYLPLSTLDERGHLGLGGVKARLKYIAPREHGQRWWYGVNFELEHVSRRLDQNSWNAELKGIVGIRLAKWTLAANLNTDFVLSGPRPGPPSFDFDTKISYAVTPKLAVGLESYNGAGDLRRVADFGSSEQSIFAVIDAGRGAWDLPARVPPTRLIWRRH